VSYRTHPLYKLAREVSGQPINWDNPQLVRLQQETRLDYMKQMHTLDLICTVVDDREIGTSWIKDLTAINALPTYFPSLDMALGQERR
jgi:hypothetical protein